jgi:hypothetical protein
MNAAVCVNVDTTDATAGVRAEAMTTHIAIFRITYFYRYSTARLTGSKTPGGAGTHLPVKRHTYRYIVRDEELVFGASSDHSGGADSARK